MLDYKSLQEVLPKFAEEAKLHFHAFGVGDLLVDKNVGHIGIKAADKAEFESYIPEYDPYAIHRYEFMSDGRRLAFFHLQNPIQCGSLGECSVIEIMEPKPETIVTTQNMVDHLEFPSDELQNIKTRLISAGIKPVEQLYPHGSALSVEVNEFLQEIKFSEHDINKEAQASSAQI